MCSLSRIIYPGSIQMFPLRVFQCFNLEAFEQKFAFLENFFSVQQRILLTFNVSVTILHHLQKPRNKVLIP